MKILRLFILASFLISLLVGFGAGSYLFNRRNTPTHTLTPVVKINSSPGMQKSIWLIAVDRLNNTTPKIEGMWLLAYIPNYTTITPLPLFPSGNSKQDAELVKTFSITKDREISPEFWDYLRKHDHPTQDYIIFDEVAAASIINLYGGVRLKGKRLTGFEALTQVPKTWDDPQGALQGQIVIMDSVCQSIFNSHNPPNLDNIYKAVGNHISSNLDLGKKLKEWQALIVSGKQKVCDFSDLYNITHLTSKP